MTQLAHLNAFLAQDDAAPFPLPGDQGEATTGTANGGGPTAAQPELGSNFFLMVIVVVGGLLLFSMLATRRDRKKREVMLTALKKHDKVQTIGGVIGSIVEVKPDHIVLKVDESSNTRLTVARSAIQQVLTSAGPTEPKA